MKYEPQNIWKGKSVVCIGGGPSIKDFPFGKLHDVTTIGCNDAFHLGFPIIDMALFCDSAWFETNKRVLNNHWSDSKIMFASVNPSMREYKISWLHAFRKKTSGFATDGSISMNRSTGAAAIHVAWAMGAREVFLLGYDCGFEKVSECRWHRHNPRPMKLQSVEVFQKGFKDLEDERAKVDPDFRITNVVDGDSSALKMFSTMEMSEFQTEVLPKIRESCSNGDVFTTSVSEADCDSVDEVVD